jgi:copper resistance protein B
MNRIRFAIPLLVATALPAAVRAQSADPSKMDMPMPGKGTDAPAKEASAKRQSKPIGGKPAPAHKHPAASPAPPEPQLDHGGMPGMAHGMPPMPGMDHADMQGIDHSMTDRAAMDHDMPSMDVPHAPVRPLTDADRAAARLPSTGHADSDDAVHSYVLLDRLEAWHGEGGSGQAWKGRSWIGTDLDRLWLRGEGGRSDGRTESADLEALYGHSVSAWWDVVAGMRHDFRPGDAQDFVAFGVQGLAPQKFGVEATAYFGEGGQSAVRFEIERELPFTQRLVLRPTLEIDAYGRDDPARGIGSGLSTAEVGLRLRYEFVRRFAPYAGVAYARAFGDTAGLRRASSGQVGDTRVVVGLRTWF